MSNKSLRTVVIGLWGIASCLGILLGVVYIIPTFQDYLQSPVEIPPLAELNIPVSQPNNPTQAPIQSGNLGQQTIAPTQSVPMATRTPLITPTDFPRPDVTRHSSKDTNPGFTYSSQVIGYSVNDLPLHVFSFGRGDSERLIVAGIHGGYEFNTISLANKLIAHLKQHPDIVPPGITLHILPSFNPDGEARSHSFDGRANENGVDLNRNFPSKWQEDWPRFGCWNHGPINAGTHPASEPETMALMDFINRKDIDALISYHSAALGIFPGGNPPDDYSLSLAATIASVSNYPYPPIDTGCQFSGQLIDWASDQGVAAIDIELTNHQNTDFDQNVNILHQFLAWSP
jgi:predicted deacylase